MALGAFCAVGAIAACGVRATDSKASSETVGGDGDVTVDPSATSGVDAGLDGTETPSTVGDEPDTSPPETPTVPVTEVADAGDPADVGADTAPPRCGDGVRNAPAEECDDGVDNAEGTAACSPACTVQDFLASREARPADAGVAWRPSRHLGHGSHPLVAGDEGFAVAFLDTTSTPTLHAEAFDARGSRRASFPSIGVPSQTLEASDAVLAALPGGAYAAVWTDDGGDGDGQGIALARLDGHSQSVAIAGHANRTTAFAQSDADAVWTAQGLVVAWTDWSNAATAPDVRIRLFDASLAPRGDEASLAVTGDAESAVTLAAFAGGWAAAWRVGNGSTESIHVRAASGVEYVVGPFAPGPARERPALVALGPTALYVAFTAGAPWGAAVPTPTVEAALVDTTLPAGTIAPIALLSPYPSAAAPVAQGGPAIVVNGAQVLLGSWTGAAPGDANSQDVWLTPLLTTGGSVAPGARSSLPAAAAHRLAAQTRIALAVTGLAPGGALVSAWEDDGRAVSGAEGAPDVVLQVTPLASARIPGSLRISANREDR